VDRKQGERPVEGAFREFVEELLGLDGEEATEMASKLSAKVATLLVGGRPFVHKKNYVIFVVCADSLLAALDIVPCRSGIDFFFENAQQNSEVNSVALVSLQEILQGLEGENVKAMSVKQLGKHEDGKAQDIQLRNVMVGLGGSICTIRDALESFNPKQLPADDSACQKPRWRRPSTVPKALPLPERAARQKAVVFDMETGDPDDILTLLFLAAHPAVNLRAVTITPGCQEQVALVRWILQQLELTETRLGAQQWPDNADKKVNLAPRFYGCFGRSTRGEPQCERADEVLLQCCDEKVTLLTGAPVHNLGDALKLPGFHLGRWVAQGGFAGEGVVPQDQQLDKFKGKETCPTWNFGGNALAAEAGLSSAAVARKVCVSKNVCHAAVYDTDWHDAVRVALETAMGRRRLALQMMYEAMDTYLKRNTGGKKLHDPLALAVALDETVCELAEVRLFRHGREWGSRLSPGSNTWISVAYDAAKFRATLLEESEVLMEEAAKTSWRSSRHRVK